MFTTIAFASVVGSGESASSRGNAPAGVWASPTVIVPVPTDVLVPYRTTPSRTVVPPVNVFPPLVRPSTPVPIFRRASVPAPFNKVPP